MSELMLMGAGDTATVAAAGGATEQHFDFTGANGNDYIQIGTAGISPSGVDFTIIVDNITLPDWTPAALTTIVSDRVTGDKAWLFSISSIACQATTYTDGSTAQNNNCSNPWGFTDGTEQTIAFEIDGNDGSSQRVLKVYYWNGSSWTLQETVTNSGVISTIWASSRYLTIGGYEGQSGTAQLGWLPSGTLLKRVRGYDGLEITTGGQSLLFDCDANQWESGTTFVSGGHTYTMYGGGLAVQAD